MHKVRNVVGRCSRELKKTAPAEAALIFKASSRSEAYRRAEAFIATYEHEAPRLAEVIRGDLDACLAFYDFDAGIWRALRSTNALERTHRELRQNSSLQLQATLTNSTADPLGRPLGAWPRSGHAYVRDLSRFRE